MERAPRSFTQTIRWAIRVLRAYARLGWVRKSQFRWEFVNQVLMDVCFYVSFVLTFSILYGLDGAGSSTLSLSGWSYAEIKVFLGMAFVSDALHMTFMGQAWHFGSDLKNGAIDSLRVRPGATVFLYFFQRFSPEGLTNLAIASAWLAYALAGVVPDGASVTRLLWALPCAITLLAWTQAHLSIFYSLAELWLLNSDLGNLLSGVFTSVAERPVEVYPSGMARFMTFIVPVAGLAWFPASLVLGKVGPGFAIGYPLVIVAFGWVVTRVFRSGLRRYESAMG